MGHASLRYSLREDTPCATMCERCSPIDEQIAHYRRLVRQLTDQQMLEAVKQLIEELDGKKKALHPDE